MARTENDFYPTPPSAIRPFLRARSLPGGRWLEPGAGADAIVRTVSRADVEWDLVELRPKARAELERLPPRIRSIECPTDHLGRPTPPELYDVRSATRRSASSTFTRARAAAPLPGAEAALEGEPPATQTMRGVSILVNKGKRKLVKGAFLATMKSGHTGVFFREGRKRLPIKHALSSRVSGVFSDKGRADGVTGHGVEVMSGAFRRLFPLELAKART